ncbi:gasdermin-E-like [Brachionichthys hirsutus]|uniref:gasdermin-E-like n=1 Tax=Brachionichthys hirsutus TaxID=412623 RepID=UPI0036043FAA
MFSKATANFVHQIDPEGSLIHVSRINDSKKLVSMALVVKRKRFWFWQRPKYHPTDFTLSKLLQGDKVLSPGVSETEFLTYKETCGDSLSGKLDTEAGPVSVKMEGLGSSKLQSCFGTLKKEELDVNTLLHDSSGRCMDMQHVLVQQLEKQAELLAVVKERIITTTSCSITQTKRAHCTFQGVLGLAGMLGNSVKVSVTDANNIESDSDVSVEIPSGTVIAYSVLELEIKKSGRFILCVQPGTLGGIEADAELSWHSKDSLNEVDGMFRGGMVPENVPFGASLNGLREMNLAPLADLPRPTQWAVFKGLLEILKDRTALAYLQCALADLCCGVTPDSAAYGELLEDQRALVSDILDRVHIDRPTGNDRPGPSPQLDAAHLLVTALEELPDEALRLLTDSRPRFLEDFNTLMRVLKDSSETLPIQSPPALLLDKRDFQMAEQLLSSCNVMLRRDTNTLWMEMGSETGLPLVVLCLSTQGLSLLSKEFM